LNISFCYKLTSQNIEIMISLLRAKGTLHTFEAMGIYVTPLAMEMVQSTSSLTRLSLCGVPALTDERLEQVRGRHLCKMCKSSTLYQYYYFRSLGQQVVFWLTWTYPVVRR
jgi:NADH:ubiquinone oxidoreductase subunit E